MHRHLLLLLAASSAMLFGQMDPPTRVARLSYASGSVSFEPAGVDEWAQATINRPLTTGDQLWADQNARAELHIGSAGLWLGSGTAFQILNLDDRNAQVQITQGSLRIRLRYLDTDDNFEVDTPGMAFTLLRPGDYRIDANPDNSTTIAVVRSGEGEVTGGGQAFTVHPGQQVIATGTDQVSFDVEGAPGGDDFDAWCSSRIRRIDSSQSRRYVNPEMIGYEDLDNNGYWRDDPQYGSVWTPRSVPSGWAPYHYGHWAWIDPWGWTWVDDQPWGFAPFHYGRWAYMSGAWGWIPGPVAVRPVYAPAMVAWIGGSHWGVSMSFGGGGGVGWVPLGPREVYVPSYRVSQRYFTHVNQSNTVVNNVNITKVYNTTIVNNNVTNINNVRTVNYVNARAPNAVVAMPASALASARPVNQVARPVSQQELAQAQVMSTAQVVPQRAAVFGRSTPSSAPRPPQRALNTSVVARTAPPPPPAAFSARQATLQQQPGRPIDPEAMQRLRGSSPAPAQARPAVRVVQAPPPGPAPAQGQRTAPAPQNATHGGRPGATPQSAQQQPPPQQAQPPSAHPASGPPPQQQAGRPAYNPPPAPQSEHPGNTPPQQQQGRPGGYGPPPGVRTGAAPQLPPAQPQVNRQVVPEQGRPAYGPPQRQVPQQAPVVREPQVSRPAPPQQPQEHPTYGPPPSVRQATPPPQQPQERPAYGPPPTVRQAPPPRQAVPPERPSYGPPPSVRETPPPQVREAAPARSAPQYARPEAPLQEVHPQPPPQRGPQPQVSHPEPPPPQRAAPAERAAPQGRAPAQNRPNANNKEKEKEKEQR